MAPDVRSSPGSSSNGNLDPWGGAGVLESLSKSLVAIVIDKGAHHLDLRSANPGDPLSVIKARDQEKRIIHSWIQEYHQEVGGWVGGIIRAYHEENADFFFGGGAPKMITNKM